MRLKINNSKFIIKMKYLLMSMLFFLSLSVEAQEIIKEEEKNNVKKNQQTSKGRIKLDGVTAIVGEFIVLNSDVDEQFQQLRAAGASIEDITDCQMFGRLLESKLLVHQAIQDSIVINDAEIRSYTEQQLNAFTQRAGSEARLLKIYNKQTIDELREDIYEINKNNKLAQDMQEKVISAIEVTPEEVRQYFNSIPEDQRPLIGTELKIGQIVVIPKPTQKEKQAVIDRLNEFKKDVEENGASFTTKATLYSDDTGSKSRGGKLPPMNRNNPQNVKEFRDVVFKMNEGEISEPFETDFGYHIVWLEKIRGQEYDVRHILLRPEIPQSAIDLAKEKLKSAREKIISGEITFANAAREISDEKETKFEGGLLLNAQTGDYNFELTNMDPTLYSQIEPLKDSEISNVIQDSDRVNEMKFKILTVLDRVNEHKANFARDYVKIKEFALNDKKIRAVAKWQKEKIEDTFIEVKGNFRKCNFASNWLKQ